MDKLGKKLIFHTVMVFAVSAFAGLLYNHYQGGEHTSVLGVLGYALVAALTAVFTAQLVVRLIRRR